MLGVYTLVLAGAAAGGAAARPRAMVGALVFGLASLACGLADSIAALLVLRGVQALGGAALLVGAFTLLDAGGAGRRAWTAAAIFGFAAGPGARRRADPGARLAGDLPRAGPIAAAAAFAREAPAAPSVAAPLPTSRPRARTARSRGGRSAGRSSRSRSSPPPSSASSSCSCCCSSPAGRSSRWPPPRRSACSRRRGRRRRARHGRPRVRRPGAPCWSRAACSRSPSLPGASLWWTCCRRRWRAPASGLALPALAGDLLPEDTAEQAANLLAIRHAGITAALILLAPVAAAQLDDAVRADAHQGHGAGARRPLPPLEKLSLAGTLLGDIDPVDPRGELQAGLDRARPEHRGQGRLRRARHARGRDARGRRAGRVRPRARDLRSARPAGRARAAAVGPARARGGGRRARPGRRRRSCSRASSPSRCSSPTRAIRASCPRPAGSRARSRMRRWWRSTAPRAASAPRARSWRWRSSTTTRATTTSASTGSTRGASADCSAGVLDLVP